MERVFIPLSNLTLTTLFYFMNETLKDISDTVYHFSDKRPILKDYNALEHHLTMSLAIEAMEVMELEKLADAFGEEEFQEKMAGELADVFIYLLEITRMYDIDLVEATINKVMLNEIRLPEEDFQEGEFSTEYMKHKRKNGERK